MAVVIDMRLTPRDLLPAADRVFELSGGKIAALARCWDPARGAPVYTVEGRYTARGWTDWTEGFQHGSALLQFDATGEAEFLRLGEEATVQRMAAHVSHRGVHDHGFNNISTYGNLLRLVREGRVPEDRWAVRFYQLALKLSGAVQASRWTALPGGEGYIYSFNGPHSLFIDTLRSLRSLAVAHELGHCLMGEQDERISLLERLLIHARTTARYAVYSGTGRDAYDVPGRVAHESLFNLNNGSYRSPNSQQGYSPFSTWTRGLAWALCGFSEQLEYLRAAGRLEEAGACLADLERAARDTAEFYLARTPRCGVPYWDTGAPGLHRMGDCLERPADPFNDHEPVDSSAAAIAAQGFLRLASVLEGEPAVRYRQAGLTLARTLFQEPYLAESAEHQGLLLHAIYHRPNGWDHIPAGRRIPCGESCLWGDYHLRELALMIRREAMSRPRYAFFGAVL